MIRNLYLIILTGILLMAYSSCTQNGNSEIENMPVVGKYVTTSDGHEIMTVDYNKLNEVVPFSLDNLIEDIRMVQLDSSTEEAMVGDGLLCEMTDNFYAVRTGEQVKLFRKDGKFISNIGRRGQGPDEYNAVYDIAIDEPSGRIYLMEMGNVNHISAYDLSGKFIGRIPLPYLVHKGQMIVEDGKIMIIAMKFDLPEENNPAIWVQDFEGNIISEIDTPVTTVIPDFSNEIFLSSSSDGKMKSISLLYPASGHDNIYSFNDKGDIDPVFTIDFGNMERIPMHFYTEYPDYYVATLYGDEYEIINGFEIVYPWQTVVVDKKTGKGSYIKPVFEKLGGFLYKGKMFGSTDYLVYNIEPGDLETLIEESIKSNPDITENQVKKLRNQLDNINRDGNNVLIYGKFKNTK